MRETKFVYCKKIWSRVTLSGCAAHGGISRRRGGARRSGQHHSDGLVELYQTVYVSFAWHQKRESQISRPGRAPDKSRVTLSHTLVRQV